MENTPYFGTHIHTQFSNVTAGLDCINKLPDLVERAKELNMSGLVITNHDNLSEAIDINRFQKKLREKDDDFCLAIGNEIYLIDEYKTSPEGKSIVQKYHHFILIAKDKMGYDALVELSSLAWYRSEVRFGRRRVPIFYEDIEEVIPKYKGHIVGTSACLGGLLPTLIGEERFDEARKFVDWCIEYFGEEDFFIELQPQSSDQQINYNKKVVEMFKDEVNFLIATDAHYLNKEDFPIFEAFLRSQQENREVKEYYADARMMGSEEIHEMMNYLPREFVQKALDNTRIIERQIEFYDLEQTQKIPKVPNLVQPEKTWVTPERMARIQEFPTLQWAVASNDSQTAFCITTCLNQLVERNLWNQLYLDRIEEEFRVMKFQSENLNDNFFAYANTMRHYIDMAWSIDCAVGPSRGSASGSLLNFLMDIVQCDPIQYNLPFWRYLNETRVTPLERYRALELNSLRGVA